MKASKNERTHFSGVVDNSEILKWHTTFQNMKIIFYWKTGAPSKCIFWALIGRFWLTVLELYYWIYHTLFLYKKEKLLPPRKHHHHQPTPKPETIFLVFSWKRMSYWFLGLVRWSNRSLWDLESINFTNSFLRQAD